jgi:hypothetical protein
MTIEEKTTEQVEEIVDETSYTPPFLRINGTFPVDGDRFESVTLDLNLGDDQPGVEHNPGRPADSAALGWILDLVATTIRELRTAGKPAPGPAGEAFVLRGGAPDAAGCDGSCGMPAAPAGPGYEEVTFLAHAGSDRWTGGDRKDAP